MQTSYFLIGEISKAQGINGEVKLKTYTDNIEHLCSVNKLYIKHNENYEDMAVEYTRIQGGDAIFKFIDVKDRNMAEGLRGTELYIAREDANPLSEGEYYISDILGFAVKDDDGNDYGKLKDVLNHGATDIYVLKNGKEEVLMPVLKSVLLHTDLEKGIIIVDKERFKEVAVYNN